MAINRFDDIEGLVCYFSADPTESNIVKSGNNVTSVDSAYGGESLQLTQGTAGANFITHDGVTKVGQALAFSCGAGDLDYSLVTLISSRSISNATWVILEQRTGAPSGTSYSATLANGGTDQAAVQVASDNFYKARIQSTTYNLTPNKEMDNAANVILYYQNGGAVSVRINATDHTTSGNGGGEADRIHIFNSGQKISAAEHTNIALFAYYNRELTATERDDLVALVEYWRDNGEAPGGSAPPTSGTFGPPVQTDNNAAVESWQWQESSDGIAWANVGTILTDTTGATTQQLTVNSAPIEANGTQVKCVATYDTDQTVDSNTATLTVQASS